MERTQKLALLCTENHSVANPIMEIGITNSRHRFGCGAREFGHGWDAYPGPAHHTAVGVGRVAGKLQEVAAILNLECAQTCWHGSAAISGGGLSLDRRPGSASFYVIYLGRG